MKKSINKIAVMAFTGALFVASSPSPQEIIGFSVLSWCYVAAAFVAHSIATYAWLGVSDSQFVTGRQAAKEKIGTGI